ncbi:MAG: Na+/H+ antiporter NhaC [Fidelibacterota bacterium]|nr:MAG: Na+/H+ antiporter NhaC [Candidatus Neomarinimicrobiota bacterium]
MDGNEKRRPSFLQSLAPLIAIALFLGLGYGVLGLRIEILLIMAAVVAGLIAVRLGYSYKEIENGILESMLKGMPAMLVVIVVGALIGSWITAGTIPLLIYYGLKIISPRLFLVTACIVSSCISLVTGTSYGTAGTIGVAFIGIAHGLGIPLGQAAGAIVAGAYFGDKLSPFSDTTNLAPIAAQSNLFDHIRHMLWTTTPAWLLGLLIYLFLGIFSNHTGTVSLEKTEMIMQVIRSSFTFHWLLLLPPVITLYLAIRKRPVIPGMLLSAVVAVILAIIVQDVDLVTAVRSMVFGYVADTGENMVDELLTRGGMLNMMDVTLIALCAFAFGGIVQKAGMLDVLLEKLLSVANTVGKIIASTVASCITTAMLTGSSFLSILIPGELFAPAFRKYGLAAKNLSRTTEDSGTVVVPLVPWSIAGVFMSGTLGVDTVVYAKWAIMCYTGFIFALIYGFTGFAIAPRIREDETVPGS